MASRDFSFLGEVDARNRDLDQIGIAPIGALASTLTYSVRSTAIGGNVLKHIASCRQPLRHRHRVIDVILLRGVDAHQGLDGFYYALRVADEIAVDLL